MAALLDRTEVSPLDRGDYLAVQRDGEDLVAPLTGEVTRVGRSLVADVFLDDTTVSRRHALVVQRDGETFVLDDRSRNGVFVNGERVTERALRDGDVLQLGRVVLRFVRVAR